MTEELSPSFSSVRVTSTCSRSSTNAEIPRAPSVVWSVRAKSRIVPACSAVEIHCFVPVIRQPPSSGVADAGRETVQINRIVAQGEGAFYRVL